MLSRSVKMLALAAIWIVAAAALVAAAAPPVATEEEIARKVKDLGDNSFAVREQASKTLWEAGRAAEAALQDAVKSSDPEVVRRSRELLDKFKWGIYPDTPKEVLELIQQYRTGEPAKPGHQTVSPGRQCRVDSTILEQRVQSSPWYPIDGAIRQGHRSGRRRGHE